MAREEGNKTGHLQSRFVRGNWLGKKPVSATILTAKPDTGSEVIRKIHAKLERTSAFGFNSP
jgi:hypothetical protein